MPEISAYTDYRAFLKDYYTERHQQDPHFSFHRFSQVAGMKSKGFLHNVLHGKRNLNQSHIKKLCALLKFHVYEARYFHCLVQFNQATQAKERSRLFEKLSKIKSKGRRPWKYQVLRNDQFEFYSQHHHSVVRSLIGMFGFNGDYKKLAKLVKPSITPRKARLSVELLLRLELLKKQGGRYLLSDRLISTPPEVTSVAVVNHHDRSLELARKALGELPASQRNVSSATLGISRQTYEQICAEVENFRFHLLSLAKKDHAADRVYQFNFQVIPVSHKARKRKSSG